VLKWCQRSKLFRAVKLPSVFSEMNGTYSGFSTAIRRSGTSSSYKSDASSRR
jgi:hypothetical protein